MTPYFSHQHQAVAAATCWTEHYSYSPHCTGGGTNADPTSYILHDGVCGRSKSPVFVATLKFHAWTKYRIAASLPLRLRLRSFKFEQFQLSSCCCIYWEPQSDNIICLARAEGFEPPKLFCFILILCRSIGIFTREICALTWHKNYVDMWNIYSTTIRISAHLKGPSIILNFYFNSQWSGQVLFLNSWET